MKRISIEKLNSAYLLRKYEVLQDSNATLSFYSWFGEYLNKNVDLITIALYRESIQSLRVQHNLENNYLFGKN